MKGIVADIVAVILVAVGIVFVYRTFYPTVNIPLETQEMQDVMMSVQFYDKNGRMVPQELSLIGGQKYDYLTVTTYVYNRGNQPINVSFSSSLPPALNIIYTRKALSQMNVPAGQQVVWATKNSCSGIGECTSCVCPEEECVNTVEGYQCLIKASQFEKPDCVTNPTRFSSEVYINFTCSFMRPCKVYGEADVPPGTTGEYYRENFKDVEICSELEVSNCANLSTSEMYKLTADIINSNINRCFSISANNVILDCQNYNIDGTDSSSTYGIYVYRSPVVYTNITIRNCKITDWGDGIFLRGNNNILINNTINSNAEGIHIAGDYNNLINNTININTQKGIYIESRSYNVLIDNIINYNAQGVHLSWANYNSVTGGSISGNYPADYFFLGAGNTNNFTNTNFTGLRYIDFFDTTSWFNYNNETTGNIWLKTNVSDKTYIPRRILVNWNNTLMKWNDTRPSGSMKINYNLTGLLSNKKYSVYNTSAGVQTNPYNLTTNNDGELTFSIWLVANMQTEIIVNLKDW